MSAQQSCKNALIATMSSSVVQNSILEHPASTAETTVNGLIQTIVASSSVIANKKPLHKAPLPVRVVHAVAASTDGNHQQPHIVRIIKHTPEGTKVSNASVINIKAPLTSPIKGATLINIPSTARLLTHASAKLQVGDTLTISNSSIVHGVSTSHQTATIPSTPTKVISVVGSANTTMLATKYDINPVMTVIHPPASIAQVGSSERLSTVSSSRTQSPLQCKRSSIFMDPTQQTSESKRRRTPNSNEKGNKGLRHFAMLVCEKVKRKVTTTYNEVADELVAEYSDAQQHISDQHYDQKNIRRRVYDALNVLMAMDIIYKDKKDIHWVGLPTNSAQEVQALQSEKKNREQRIQQKTLQLQELILQQIAFKNLVQRNKRLQQTHGPPPQNSSIQLPFIIVNTHKKTIIDCSISNDKYEYMFNFDNTFEIHDDIEVLKRMGMAYGLEAGSCSKENLKTAQTLVPPVLKPYLEDMAGHSKGDANTDITSAKKYTLQDVPRIVQQSVAVESELKELLSRRSQIRKEKSQNHIKVEQDMLNLGTYFTMGHRPDAEDQEVAMVTEESQTSSNSSGIAMGLTSSRSSSSGLHSGVMSTTPLSSCADSGSRSSTPLEPFDI